MQIVHSAAAEGEAGIRPGWAPLVPPVLLACSLAGGGAVWLRGAPLQAAGLVMDSVTTLMAILVSGIGTAIIRYAARSMEGNPRRRSFLGWTAGTVAAGWLLAVADAAPILVASWMAVGVGLDRMLRTFPDRPGALVTARRKFILSRVGDALLIAAFVIAWVAWDAGGVSAAAAAAARTEAGGALTAFALLVSAAAMVKSAQVPLHGWLPETMEAPTPVSALMHAGIVNAGGALLVRLAPAVARVPEAWLALSLVGTLSILLAVPAMRAQARAKTALAWSTVAQMGFMLVQCGLCAFPAAVLHILGHGAYKAWSFLGAGWVGRAPAAPPRPVRALTLLAAGTAAAALPMALWAWLSGAGQRTGPGDAALLAVAAMAVGQAWVACLGRPAPSLQRGARRAVAALAATALIPAGLIGLYAAASLRVAPVTGPIQDPSGPLAWIAAALPVCAIAALAAWHALLPALEARRPWRSFRVHALSGFYVAAFVGRGLDRVHALLIHRLTGAKHA